MIFSQIRNNRSDRATVKRTGICRVIGGLGPRNRIGRGIIAKDEMTIVIDRAAGGVWQLIWRAVIRPQFIIGREEMVQEVGSLRRRSQSFRLRIRRRVYVPSHRRRKVGRSSERSSYQQILHARLECRTRCCRAN